MKVLVSGASGLLGRSALSHLSDSKHRAIAMFRSSSGLSTQHESVICDLSRNWPLSSLPSDVDAVVHLAQSSRFRDFPAGANDVFRVNVESTARLLGFSLDVGVGTFVYASTGGLYRGGTAPVAENAPLGPLGELGFYLGSKAAGEILAQSYSSLMNVVVLRPFFIYGKGQKRNMLIPRLYDSVRMGRPIRLDGPDGITVNPVHVDDASMAFVAALALDESTVINVAGPESLSMRVIAEAFGQHLGVAPVFEFSSQPTRSLVGSIEMMTERLHQPERRLLDSIDDIAEEA